MTRRSMGRVGLAIVAAALLLVGPEPVAADLGGYVIQDFHTDITVQEDASLLVEERIEVMFSEERHGIYRTIPVRHTDPRGMAYSIGLRVLGVENDVGDAHETKITNERQRIKIRIGDADRTVSGEQVYIIRYRVQEAVKSQDGFDVLSWNAIGDEWQANIMSASATVHLPGDLPPELVEPVAFSGYYGGTDSDVTIEESAGGEVAFATNRTLGPREGMTVTVVWPEGYVRYPSALEIWLRRLADNWIIVTPLAVLAWVYRRYRQSGRDPEALGSVTVRYQPPEGVGPGEIGTIVDEKVDLVDITATVVDLAVKGHLTIGVEEKQGLFNSGEMSVFERRADSDTSELLPHETQVLDALFEDGEKVTSDDLKERFYRHVPTIKHQLYEHMTELGFFSDNPDSVRTHFFLYGFGMGILVLLAGMGWAWWRGILMPYALIAPGIAAVLTAIIYFGFAGAMPSRTKKGVQLRAWALGFEEFVDRVESDRLDRAEARNAFETLLPYAMALGVASTWARKFEGIYEEAGPGWYVGPAYHGHFSTLRFESSLSSAMKTTATTMAQAPRSSSSGGGGFSGGGFGGGGGGSW